MQRLGIVADRLERVVVVIGKGAALLTVPMVLLTVFGVVQRYFFNHSFIWQEELVMAMHALSFLLVSGYALRDNAHVRVDILYGKLSERGQAWVELLGNLFFLLPFMVAVLVMSWDFVLNSWQVWEGSREPGGLPGVFLMKTSIWLFALVLIAQMAAHSCRVLLLFFPDKTV